MITANTRRGLLGMGDMGLVVRADQLGRTEDTLILGIGRKMQRNSVLLGGVDTAVARQALTALQPTTSTSTRTTMTLLPRTTTPIAPAPTTTVAPRPTIQESYAAAVAARLPTEPVSELGPRMTIQPVQPTYTAPSYSPMPTAPAPIPETRVPDPGYDTSAPRPVSPSGATATWTQTPASPVPTYPPVVRPAIPAAPVVQPSPVDYTGEAGVSASNPSDWGYYGSDPYAPRPKAQPAGTQAQDVGTSMVYQPEATSPSFAPTDVVATNPDGTQVQQDGKVVDPTTNTVVGTDWLQWAKDNKATIGIGAAVLVGAIVILKVIK